MGDYSKRWLGGLTDVGETATWGSLVLRNTGNAAARIDQIELSTGG
jgi:hypothetical protein